MCIIPFSLLALCVFFARIHGEERVATALGRAVFLGQLIEELWHSEIGNRAGTPRQIGRAHV